MSIDFSTLDSSDIATKEETLAAFIEDEYFLDTSIGTAIREHVIRPAAALAVYQDALNTEQTSSMTLASAALLENADSALIENLASNFRLTRLSGTQALGVLAVYTQQTSNIYITPNMEFTYNDITMGVTQTYIGTLSSDFTDTSEVIYKQMAQYDSDTYVFTVPVITTEATSESIPVGASISFTPSNAKISSVTVASAISGGSTEETTSALIQRAISGVTAKVPSGRQHIAALISRDLNENYSDIKVFGMNDSEMLRDTDNIMNFSMGGRSDAYIKTSTLPSIITLSKQARYLGDNQWQLTLTSTEAPGFYSITEISNSGTTRTYTADDEISYTFDYNTGTSTHPAMSSPIHTRFSIYQTATVTFTFEGVIADENGYATFSINVQYMEDLSTIQSYFLTEDIKNTSQDLLIKAPVPCFIGMDITVTYPQGYTDITETAIKTGISTAINTLPIGRGYVNAYDISKAITNIDSNLSLSFPVYFESATWVYDSLKRISSSTGNIEPSIDTTYGITKKNVAFFCNSSDININLEARETTV